MSTDSKSQWLSDSGIFVKRSGEFTNNPNVDKPIVLLHGLFGSLENVGGIARLLSKEYGVYSLDLPNHGRSRHIDESSLSTFADRIEMCLDELGVQESFVVGHSLGGKVAMEVALRKPLAVKKLVVLDIAPVKYPRRHDDVFQGLSSIDLKAIKSRGDADKLMKAQVPELAVRSFLLKNLYKVDDNYSWRMNLASIKEGYEQLINANANLTYENDVLFLKGENSNYITEEYRKEILSRFPKTQLKIVSDTEHWLHAEKPDIVASIIQRFLV